MAYHHIGDEPGKSGAFQIWRCAHCRALYVGRNNSKPPSKCGKCAQ